VRESLTLNRLVEGGSRWASEGPILPRKPGNAGGGKWPWFWVLRTEPRRGDWPRTVGDRRRMSRLHALT
jgi:hypothetical protein